MPTFLDHLKLVSILAIIENDEFNSNAMAGRLAYTTPSVMTLMNAQIWNFDGSFLPNGVEPNTLIYGLSIQNSEDDLSITCNVVQNCKMQYRRDYTGLLLDVSAPNVFYDQLIEFHVNAKATQDINGTPKDALFPFRSMTLGKTLVDQAELYIDGDRIAQFTHDVLPGYVGTLYPGLDSTPHILFHNGYLQNFDSATHCNLAGDDCYSVKTHARIDGISAGSGFITGGQNLIITGVGLNSTNIEVLVDGVHCAVTNATSTTIYCVTGATATVSTTGDRPGQPGLSRTKTQADGTVSSIDLMTALNHFDLVGDTNKEDITGWFTAPTTGLYRFYISCDFGCSFSIDATNPYVAGATNSPNPVIVANRNWSVAWRSYWQNNDKQKSDWISLTEGESYFVASTTKQYGRTIDMTVSMEIKPTDPTQLSSTHPKLAKTIQQLAMDPENTPETWWVTVTNPDSGTFKLNLLNPTTTPASYWQSGPISASASAAEFKSALTNYYYKFFGLGFQVTKSMYDASSVATNDPKLALTVIYTVTLLKQINGMSANAISVTKGTSTSTFAVSSPSIGGIKSSPPLSGFYAVQCTDSRGVVQTSTDIAYNANPYLIGKVIMDSIPFLSDRVQVNLDYRYPYYENGLSFLLQFIGLNYEVPQCKIVSGSASPLVGTLLAENNTVIQNYGGSVFFEPITLDFLSSDAQSPQVLVTVEGIPALCANLNCDYLYVDSVGTITDQSLSGTTLTITGTNLPTTEDLVIMLGPVKCNVVSNTATTITCDLVTSAVSGNWIVTVTSPNGLIPNEITTELTIPVAVSSISPNSLINYLGGDLITITGDNFGFNATAINVTFDDSTSCVVQSVKMDTIACVPNEFSSNRPSTSQVTVEINSVSDNSLSVSMVASLPTALQMVPSSASPVLKTDLTITLPSDYPYTLDAADFTATLLSSTDPYLNKPLYVVRVDDAAKTLVIKFPGAVSGQYHVQLSTSQQGRIESHLLALTVIGRITSVSPLTGSIYGGALITITGENFSNEPHDNPVKIGNNYCYVITSSPTEITCRTDLLTTQIAQNEQVLVFLKTSEEAKSDDDIFFTYTIPDATVTDISASFDKVNYQVVVTGTGLDATTELYLDDIAQQLIAFDSFSATFNVVGLNDVTTSNVKVITSYGYPEGMEIAHSLTFQPTLVSVSPSAGSSAGSWITVTGSGFGLQTQGLNIQAGTQELCSQVVIVSYGVFNCLTNPIEVTSETALQITINGNTVASIATVTYEQSVLYPVTSTSLSGVTISFTGSNFPTDGSYIASATFGGVAATTTTILSSTSVEASWSNTGIPAVTEAPVLFFTSSDLSHWHIAQPSNSITQTLTVTSSTAISCSFAGGCQYSVTADGLYATLLNAQNTLQVCANTCKLRPDLSDNTRATCDLPQLTSSYSVENYKIQKSAVLNETIFPENSVLYDNNLLADYVDLKASGCNFGMSFKPNHVGVLDEAKIFINKLTDRTVYVNNLQFQGSNDNWKTKVVLHTFGANIHEGWNLVKFDAAKPQYNSYRFYGLKTNSCRVTEFRLIGVEAIADTNPTFACTPSIMIGSTKTADVLQTVTYDAAFTPYLTSISPRFGSVLGGTAVTLNGSNLLGAASAYVAFDNRVCTVQSQTDTQIVCITDDKPYVPDTPLVSLSIGGLGNVATQGLVYRYVSLWSDAQTWGYDLPPLEGESVSIPTGQHLLVDVNPPVLNAIIVEGSLIFAPNETDSTHLATFDAHYIMINGGHMEVGTLEFPYTSKIQITMHSDRFDPYLPMYGNKVIAVRFGTLDLHGIPRDYTWTQLASTAQPGATSITLLVAPDWQAGEEIVIATTSFSNTESETRIITSVDGNTIYFDEPLLYMHLSEVPIYNGIEMPMQGEVGLLTRNVLYRGDPVVSPRDLYGAHIMICSPGDDSVVGRIRHVELKDVGQAFKLGRYPIHFHMIGAVHESIVEGNAIHQTYNRAVTTHGVHYFKVLNNVAFDTMGHTFFIEDAIESNNIYDHNLAVQTKASLSLLNSDGTPAGFWITFPDNIFTNNNVAGSDSHGFWFDLQKHSMGPSFDVNVCGMRAKLGQFSNNTAHSVKMYGFRIWHMHLPQASPCDAPVFDPKWASLGKTDPYWKNPQIPSVFENFIGYKCLRNGAISERTGAVTLKNFKIADSGLAGIEISVVEGVEDNKAFVDGGLIVGNTYLNDEHNIILDRQIFGFWGPITENMTVTGVSFANFEHHNSAALTTCSHCVHLDSTDSGGRTYRTSNLTFDDATVPKRIFFSIPFREIIEDLDGSLLNAGAHAFVSPYFLHNMQPECTLQDEKYNGIVCDPSVQIRKIVFHGYAPTSLLMAKLKVSQWDSDFEQSIKADNVTYFDYLQDKEHKYFSISEQREKKDPMNSWALPYVTGHSYRLHWAEGIDFTQMTYSISSRWQPTDKNIKIMTNFTDAREAFNVTDQKKNAIANETFNKAEADLVNGDNVIYNQTDKRELHFVVNGKNKDERTNLKITAIKCLANCTQTVVVVPISNKTNVWSAPTSWPSGKVPLAGEDVEIVPGANIILDVETPLLNKLVINGRLTFLNNLTNPLNLTLHAQSIFVHGGELIIGNETHPFNGEATIKLYGAPTDPTLAFSDQIEGGNKILAITGLAKMYGQHRDSQSRLMATVKSGALEIQVDAGLDWKAGDRIALLPTAVQHKHTDYNEIASYDRNTGNLQLVTPLNFYHWGTSVSTSAKYNGVDTRGEVIMLSRNVRVVGNDSDTWGGQVVVSDTLDITGVSFNGQLVMDSVEIYNCSQHDTYKSAIRFEGANTNQQSITNSTIHGSLGWPFSTQDSSNILVDSTTMIGGRQFGVQVIQSENIMLNNLVVSDIMDRPGASMVLFVDKTACIEVCALENEIDKKCNNVTLTNTVVSGCIYAGYIQKGHTCGASATQTIFRNNVAHSVSGTGAVIYPDPTDKTQKDCYEISHYGAYKNSEGGLTIQQEANEIRANHFTLIDNVQGISIQPANGAEPNGPKQLAVLENSFVYGETEAQDCPNKKECFCTDKFAVMLFGANRGDQPIHQRQSAHLPLWNIMSYSQWASDAKISNVTFSGFTSNITDCGKAQKIFQRNPQGSDFIPTHKLSDITFDDVSDDAIAYLEAPNPGWNNPKDCIGFPCTAPSNMILDFVRTKYTGNSRPSFTDAKFQIVSNTAGASETFENCKIFDIWNAWRCTNSNLGQLVFRADNSNQEIRSVAPVYVTNPAKNFTNVLNSFMDHTWDGFYTGQLHKSQFISFVETDQNYTIEYSSTPFSMMTYSLRAEKGQIKVYVPYWNAGSYNVYVNNTYIPPTPWNKTAGSPSELTGLKGCGENRFVGVKNYLEFIITAGCELQVLPVDAIVSNVRMQWTMDEFYASGGVVSFADRVASALGIPASQIKTVAVYKGSVVVEYNILAQNPATAVSSPLTSTASASKLRTLKTQLNTLVSSNSAATVFGAKVLSASTDGTAIISDPNYNPGVNPTPVSIPQTPSVQNVTVTNNIPLVSTQSSQADAAPVAISASNQQLLWILLVVVLLCLCCFGVGAGVICAIKMTKKPAQPVYEMPEKVEIDLAPQFHVAQDIELDIFSKKRTLKVNDDNVDREAELNLSEKKLISTDESPSQRPLQNSE